LSSIPARPTNPSRMKSQVVPIGDAHVEETDPELHTTPSQPTTI
jgi:hypothetical protein